MPASIADSAESYGTIGVAISLASWLVAAGFVLVICAAVGVVIRETKVGARSAREHVTDTHPGEPA